MEMGSGILGKIDMITHGASIYVDIRVQDGDIYHAGMKLSVLAPNFVNRGNLRVISIERNHLYCSELPAGTSQGDYLQLPGLS